MRHTIALFGAALLGASALVWAPGARAQERSYLRQPVPAPNNALELKVGTSYTQGFGRVAPMRSISDVAGVGIGVNVDADYRVNSLWSMGVQGEFQEFANGRNSAARGVAANVGPTFHARPLLRGDPYLRLAGGYRLLWDVSPPGEFSALRHGFEIAKATLGYDVRISDAVAISPQVGADVNLFVWQSRAGVSASLTSPQWGMFVFAGVQGRFDLGGQRTTTANVAGGSAGDAYR
jgi:hypothetical protein